MEATLRGPRVTLRPLREADAEVMLRSTQDPEVRRLTGTHRVFTMADIVDERAQKSYARSGFAVEGVKREALRWGGERHDVIMMAALAPDRESATPGHR